MNFFLIVLGNPSPRAQRQSLDRRGAWQPWLERLLISSRSTLTPLPDSQPAYLSKLGHGPTRAPWTPYCDAPKLGLGYFLYPRNRLGAPCYSVM